MTIKGQAILVIEGDDRCWRRRLKMRVRSVCNERVQTQDGLREKKGEFTDFSVSVRIRMRKGFKS